MRQLMHSIKWTPVIVTLAMILAFIFALYDFPITKHITPKFGYSLIIFWGWWAGSKAFRFCNWHKVLIINLFIVMLIININNDIYAIPWLYNTRLILLILVSSCLISTFLRIKYGLFKNGIKKTTIK